MNGKPEPRLISIIVFVYRWISKVFPKDFYDRHSEDFLRTLEDICLLYYQEEGNWKLFWHGGSEIVSLITNIASAYRDTFLRKIGFRVDVNLKAFKSVFEHPIEVLFLLLLTLLLAQYSSNFKNLTFLQIFALNFYVATMMLSLLVAFYFKLLFIRDISGIQINKHPQTMLFRSRSILKDFLDLMLVIPSLLALGPLILLITIVIKIDSAGPVFHKRRVVGLNGRVFDVYKFRTVQINGDEALGDYTGMATELNANFKLEHDPQITRIGRLLRIFSLDELPQLFNVVARDMSLVGPRIVSPEQLRKYGKNSEKLLTTLPGLTGLWQVSGEYTTYEDRISFDMMYIDNWSIWLDIKILFRTVHVVLRDETLYSI